jgi:SAM-dependent methyltransferase
VELGCGSGLLTRYLVDAGHQVIATDASPAMLDLARQTVPDARAVLQVVLPDDAIPEADAVVGVGHVLNYLPDEQSVARALAAVARALRPGGLLALDLCDIEWGEVRRDAPGAGRMGDGWAIVIEFSVPRPERFVRQIATFLEEPDGSWRRDDERHENVLVDTARIPALLAGHGVEATVAPSFGSEQLPAGLYAIKGRRTG